MSLYGYGVLAALLGLCTLVCFQLRAAAATASGEDDEVIQEAPPEPAVAKESLLRATAKARKDKPEETEAEIMLREEQEMLADMTKRTALRGVKELAKVCACARRFKLKKAGRRIRSLYPMLKKGQACPPWACQARLNF